MTSMRRHYVASTSIRRCCVVMCLLGWYRYVRQLPNLGQSAHVRWYNAYPTLIIIGSEASTLLTLFKRRKLANKCFIFPERRFSTVSALAYLYTAGIKILNTEYQYKNTPLEKRICIFAATNRQDFSAEILLYLQRHFWARVHVKR